MTVHRLGILGAVMLLAGCGSTPSATTSAVPTGGAPAAAAGCVSDSAARDIWTRIDQSLNAVILDPQHQGLSDVATGSALTDLQDYIKTTLVAKHLTEREVDRLDNVAVADPACTNGSPLRLTITTTATRDDYLKADGTLDHSDPAVGRTFHIDESFERVGGVWKESSFARLDAPSPSPQLVGTRERSRVDAAVY